MISKYKFDFFSKYILKKLKLSLKFAASMLVMLIYWHVSYVSPEANTQLLKEINTEISVLSKG